MTDVKIWAWMMKGWEGRKGIRRDGKRRDDRRSEGMGLTRDRSMGRDGKYWKTGMNEKGRKSEGWEGKV